MSTKSHAQGGESKRFWKKAKEPKGFPKSINCSGMRPTIFLAFFIRCQLPVNSLLVGMLLVCYWCVDYLLSNCQFTMNHRELL